VRQDIDRALEDALGGRVAAAAESVSAVARWADLQRVSASTLGALANAEFLLERYRDALRHFDRALARTRPGQVPVLLLGRCRALVAVGRLAEADDDAARAEALEGELLSQARTMRAWTMLWRHGPEAAEEPARQGLRGRQDQTALQTAQMVLAHVLFAQRRYAEALHVLEETPQAWRQANWFSGIADCYAAIGDCGAAVHAAACAERGARTMGLAAQGARASLAMATAALAADDHRVALSAALAASDHFSGTGRQPWAAQSYLIAAQACERLGETYAAQAFVGRARSIADGCGSRWLHSQVANGLRRSGARQRRKRPSHRVTLTRREEQVAWLAAQGLSNPEIGGRLFIGRRTVETHLSRIFRKLGVSGRSALGLRLGDGGVREVTDAIGERSIERFTT
jgi:DNA-binding CsgD family transcriptional regulator/tetratricopeptide (TPR) repeat protein